MIFFTVTHVKAFYEVPLTPTLPPLFSMTRHHEKRWNPPTPYAWRSYWTTPDLVLKNIKRFS